MFLKNDVTSGLYRMLYDGGRVDLRRARTHDGPGWGAVGGAGEGAGGVRYTDV